MMFLDGRLRWIVAKQEVEVVVVVVVRIIVEAGGVSQIPQVVINNLGGVVVGVAAKRGKSRGRIGVWANWV